MGGQTAALAHIEQSIAARSRQFSTVAIAVAHIGRAEAVRRRISVRQLHAVAKKPKNPQASVPPPSRGAGC